MSMSFKENVHFAIKPQKILELWREKIPQVMTTQYYLVIRFMKPIFTWIAREDDDLDVDLIKNQMTKSSNY